MPRASKNYIKTGIKGVTVSWIQDILPKVQELRERGVEVSVFRNRNESHVPIYRVFNKPVSEQAAEYFHTKSIAAVWTYLLGREEGLSQSRVAEYVAPEPFKSTQEQIDFLEGEIDMFKREQEELHQNVLNLKERLTKINEISTT